MQNTGYARVSTRDQTVALQVDALKEVGCEKVYTEVISGAATERPILAKLLEEVRPGDIVVVWKLDRLGRSLKHLVDHRSELHSRTEDWLRNLPSAGIRAMCSWERFCTFAREPERRKVAIDARVTIDGTPYEVDTELAGEDVVLWWGLFDQELFVEHGEKRFGPYLPVGGPIPLNRYRTFKKSAAQTRADRIEILAAKLELPRADWKVGLTSRYSSAPMAYPPKRLPTPIHSTS